MLKDRIGSDVNDEEEEEDLLSLLYVHEETPHSVLNIFIHINDEHTCWT